MIRAFVLSVALVLVATTAQAGNHQKHDIKIARKTGGIESFQVEYARNDADREYGLMNRKIVLPTEGMLFQYEEPGIHAFWMKDTLAPLDMIFFAPDGSITYIHPNAQPMDLSTVQVPGRQDVCAVLELGGGGAAQAGLSVGDRMVFDEFPSACLPASTQ